jgi:hypothetical protein
MDTGSTVQQILIAKRGNGGLTGLRRLGDYINETKYAQAESGTERGWTATLYSDTTQVAGADDPDCSGDGTPTAGSSNHVQCTHATNPNISARRERWTRTTKLDSLRGRFDVWLRCKPADSRKYYLRGKWGPSTSDPAPNVMDEVLLDTTALGTPPAFGYVEVKLGTIALPTDPAVLLGGLAIEVWSRIGDGATAKNLDWDLIWLTPADPQACEDSVSTVFVDAFATEQVIGKNLTTASAAITGDPAWAAGAASNNVMRLNANHESCGWGANAGLVLGTGRHRFTFKMASTLKGSYTVWVRVANITDNSEAPTGAGTSLRRAYTSAVPGQVVIEFDGVAAKAYQPAVAIQSYGSSGQLDVKEIDYDFIPSLASGEQFRADGMRYALEKLDSSGNILVYAQGTGEVPFIADPGLNVLAVRSDEVPLQGFLERQNKITRAPTITPLSYRPGYYQL